MKISYAQLFQAAPHISILVNKPFSTAVAIKLMDIIDILNPHLTAIEQFRDSLQTNTGEKSQEELSLQFAEYLNTTTADLGSFTPVFPEEMDSTGLAFTVREIASVRFMFASPLPNRPTT